LQVPALQHFLRLAFEAAARLVQFGVVSCGPVAHTLRTPRSPIMPTPCTWPLLCQFWGQQPKTLCLSCLSARHMPQNSPKTVYFWWRVSCFCRQKGDAHVRPCLRPVLRPALWTHPCSITYAERQCIETPGEWGPRVEVMKWLSPLSTARLSKKLQL